ncbi:MAG: LysM peptidoglycan-binding domain-containing protein [Verrucomicrobiae bacterium]|nr:LysM peptidoglycan-binding domain-containing protein [Verrucomicrobiae bacterium]
MKHGKTPTPAGAAGRLALVAVIVIGMLAGNGFAQTAKEEKKGPEEKTPKRELFTNVYVVPPNFPTYDGSALMAPPDDEKPKPRRSARDVLESFGVSFGEGCTATFNPQTSQLIIRQTRDQMELVEAVLESIRSYRTIQIYLTYQIIESDERLLEELREAGEMQGRSPADPDSGIRRVGSDPELPKPPVPTLKVEGTKVFTADELAAFLEHIQANKRGRIRRAPGLLARSGQRWEMWVADALVEIDPVVGADNFSVDLNLTMKNGRPDQDATVFTKQQITMWDGETAAFEEKLKDGTFRTRLIKAELVDPARMRFEKPLPDLHTRTFHLPGFPTDDPTNREAHDVRGVLEKQGIEFGPDSRAIYNPATGVLVVRNTLEQLDAVEAIAQDWVQASRKQIFFSIREVELPKVEAEKEMGWMLDLDDSSNVEPGVAGVFTDPQFQVAIRALKEKEAVKFTSLPNLQLPSGQYGYVEVGDRRWGVHGVIGGDEYTVNIDFRSLKPEEKWPRDPGTAVTPGIGFSVTIWEGQTIVFRQPSDDGNGIRMTFITAQLVDSASDEASTPRKPPQNLTSSQQNAVKKADELALRGSQRMMDGEITEAAELFAESVRLLPEHPITKDRREAYQKQLENALRKELEAKKREIAISLFPEPSTDDFHAAFEIGEKEKLINHDVFRGETLFEIAQKYGTSPDRIRVINRLPGNTLKVGDRLLVPVKVKPDLPTWERPEEPIAEILGRTIVIPRVEFQDLPLGDALDILQKQSVEHDHESLTKPRGIDIILTGANSFAETRITLNLQNVPLIEALRYTVELANAQMQFDGNAVLISPKEKHQSREIDVPDDLWFFGFNLVKVAEEAEENGDVLKALDAYRESEKLFDRLDRKYPDYYPKLLEYRLKKVREKIETLEKESAPEE